MPVFLAADGRRLHHLDEGAGPAVLCLAGLSRNHRDFDVLAAALKGRFRVLRLDSRGRGGSERAEDPAAEYQVPVEAGDALALLDRLGLESVAVVGTSRGGILGLAMAAARPGSVKALVLNDVGVEVATAGLRRIMGYLGRAPEVPDFEAATDLIAEANAAAFPGVPRARWAAHARAIFDDDGAGRPVLSYDARLAEVTAAGMAEIGETIDLWPLFAAAADVPVLVVRGANSDILTAETLAAMRAARPDLEAVEVPDRGHAPFLDEPEAAAAIESFLERWA
ncbi:MAG TPA: alpha/beta hydrolase [Paracoccaceae bacterium]|nr:alpha/beta hydrolase [Paracoccaceae bacterium]